MRALLMILVAALFVFAACVQAPPTTETNETNETVGNYTPAEPIDTAPSEENGASDVDYDAVIEGVEGETIRLNPRVEDPDGDPVTIYFEPPFDQDGAWQTERGAAGEFTTTIVASDGELNSSVTVLIRVLQANLPPVIQGPEAFFLDEGEILDLGVVNITDPEGDDIIVSYAGWTNTRVTETTFGDAGVHNVTIIAQDTAGNEARKDIAVFIDSVNRPPVLTIEQTEFTVTEGEEVRIRATAEDPDGDTVTIRYGTPFDAAGRWTPARGDAGTYRVPVTASDGTDTVEQIVEVIVQPANRPPVIEVDDRIVVSETETVDFNELARITDPDGDEVTVTYSGWMTGPVRETDFGDAGEYDVTITADDGELTSEVAVRVVVERTNRPPVFIRPA